MSLRITFTAAIMALTAAITCSTASAATPLDFEVAANYTLGQACSVEKANPNNPKAQKGFRFGYLEAYGFFARAYNRGGGQPPLVSRAKPTRARANRSSGQWRSSRLAGATTSRGNARS